MTADEDVAFSFEHSVVTTASPEAVWALYSDVSTWSRWNPEVDSVELATPFGPGATGIVRPDGVEPLPLSLPEVLDRHAITVETTRPDRSGAVRFRYVIEPVPDGTRITHRVTVNGAAPGAVPDELGAQLGAAVREAVEIVAELAEDTETPAAVTGSGTAGSRTGKA
jgi:hypothetical protein